MNSPENFCYWLKGFLESTPHLSGTLKTIEGELAKLFTAATPAPSMDQTSPISFEQKQCIRIEPYTYDPNSPYSKQEDMEDLYKDWP